MDGFVEAHVVALHHIIHQCLYALLLRFQLRYKEGCELLSIFLGHFARSEPAQICLPIHSQPVPQYRSFDMRVYSEVRIINLFFAGLGVHRAQYI